MGVYIPNMEKPEYCRVCHERLKCKQYDGEILHTPDDCPLIEIVTCKECKWWESAKNGWNGWCRKQIDAYATFYADDFCSYGERRE